MRSQATKSGQERGLITSRGMGDKSNQLRPQFNGSVRIEGRPERLTSESGVVLLREVMERLGITSWLVERLVDTRKSELITHSFAELIRTVLLLLSQGWRDQNDADGLRDDPALRLAVSDRKGIEPLHEHSEPSDSPAAAQSRVPEGLASQPTLSRFIHTLSSADNRAVLRESLLEVAARRMAASRQEHRYRYVTIDVDSLPIEVHGQQPGSEYNGHYHVRMYHPLVASVGETGDLLDVKLREGAVHTAEGGLDFILPLLDQAEHKLCQVASVRMDAGFPEDKLLTALEQRRTPYVARVKNNAVLNRMAEPYLKPPAGPPSEEPRTWFYEMQYQAGSWSHARRVVLVTLERPGQLFLDHFWLITNWTAEQMNAQSLLDLYRQRGTAEGYMGELMDVLAPALSSSARPKSHYRGKALGACATPMDAFAHNEVILLLNLLAYNILHTTRTLMKTATDQSWSLRRVRERVLRVAGRIVIHARRATLILADVSNDLWNRLWQKLMRFQFSGKT